MIVKGKRELKEKYNALGPADIFLGHLTGKDPHALMFIDLLERGVRCYPSPLSQILNGSKVAQAIVLNHFMAPHTLAISRRYDLMEAVSAYNKHGIQEVITKADKMDCGHGVRKWKDVETLYSYVAHSDSEYPFVLQPFLENFTDVRVIIVDDYLEAYTRENLYNFRQNISAGGKSRPCEINEEQNAFCLEVMERGKFPYGHMDLQIFSSGKWYLSEIALNGGIRGARIQRESLEKKKREVLERLVAETIHR